MFGVQRLITNKVCAFVGVEMIVLKYRVIVGFVGLLVSGGAGCTGCAQEPMQATYQNYCEGRECSPCTDDSQCYSESEPCGCDVVCSPQEKTPYEYSAYVCEEEDRCEPSGQACRCIDSQCRFD